MVSLANLDQILEVDVDARTVTVQAGARVSQVIDALRPYGLTLPNWRRLPNSKWGALFKSVRMGQEQGLHLSIITLPN
jgi:L-galactono-1,4-lactone dehydrogenase